MSTGSQRRSQTKMFSVCWRRFQGHILIMYSRRCLLNVMLTILQRWNQTSLKSITPDCLKYQHLSKLRSQKRTSIKFRSPSSRDQTPTRGILLNLSLCLLIASQKNLPWVTLRLWESRLKHWNQLQWQFRTRSLWRMCLRCSALQPSKS
jgi:hypothetical protein